MSLTSTQLGRGPRVDQYIGRVSPHARAALQHLDRGQWMLNTRSTLFLSTPLKELRNLPIPGPSRVAYRLLKWQHGQESVRARAVTGL